MAGHLTDVDRRALTPLFWSNVNPYGRFRLDMERHLDLGCASASADAGEWIDLSEVDSFAVLMAPSLPTPPGRRKCAVGYPALVILGGTGAGSPLHTPAAAVSRT